MGFKNWAWICAHSCKAVRSLRKAYERNKITQPSDSTIEGAKTGIEICEKHLNKLRPVAFAKQRKHLTEQLRYRRGQEHKKTQCNIERMMNREKKRSEVEQNKMCYSKSTIDHRWYCEWLFQTSMDNGRLFQVRNHWTMLWHNHLIKDTERHVIHP